jgi:hypothetical protein
MTLPCVRINYSDRLEIYVCMNGVNVLVARLMRGKNELRGSNSSWRGKD